MTMQMKLRLMQSFLEDASRLDVHAQYSVDRQQISDIREQSLDAEDVVEFYLAKLELRKRDGIFNKFKRCAFFIKELIDIHRVGSEIKAIKSNLEILERSFQANGMTRPGDASSSSGGQWQRQRQTVGHVRDLNIVGLDGKTEEVVGLLFNKEEPCRVVSIFGMDGLGKTTLAKKVYQNGQIRSHFEKCVWVCVSQQFNPRDILEAVYIELKSHSHEQQTEIRSLTDNQIVSQLYELERVHKYFIVLDDIWSIEAWKKLSDAFPVKESESGSKILFTTRIYGGLEPLSPDQSWDLLQRIAFAGRENIRVNEGMEGLGKEIIRCLKTCTLLRVEDWFEALLLLLCVLIIIDLKGLYYQFSFVTVV